MKYSYHSFFTKKTGLILILALCSLSIAAQNSLDSVQHLEGVVVSSRSYRETIAPQRLSGVKIGQLNSLSVADAIRYFSGVQLKDYGGIGGIKTVNIRGMGTQHVAVFYDGCQMGNAQNGIVDLGKFSLDNVDEIAIYDGQKSDVFQSAKEFACGAAIYIAPRRPKFTGTKTSNIKATLRAGSFDLFNTSLLVENKLSEKVFSSFNAEWTNASGKYSFRYRRQNPLGEVVYDTTAVRRNGDINATRIEGALYGYINNGSWNIRGYTYNSERGVPGAIVNNVWRRGERLWDTNSFLQGYFKKDISKKLKTHLKAKYATDFTHYVNNDDKLIKVDNIFRQKELYVSSANIYSIAKNWDASVSYDFQWNRLDADLLEFPYPTRFSNYLSFATAFEWKKLRMHGSLLGVSVHEKVKKYSKPSDILKYIPAIFATYKPFTDKGLYINAFYKKSFRLPSFNDLYYTDMGNANLKPEYVTQHNLGILYETLVFNSLLKSITIRSNVYYNKVTDKIVSYPKGQQFRWTTLNLGKVKAKGFDISLNGSFKVNKITVDAGVQYNYLDERDFTDPSDTYYGDQIPYTAWNSGSAFGSIHYDGWSLNYSFIYTGERYNQQENIRYNDTQPWYTSDMSIMKNFVWKAKRFRFTTEINNLFSQDYDVILNYPMPKRNYRFALSVEL